MLTAQSLPTITQSITHRLQMGDAMFETVHSTNQRKRLTPALVGVVAVMLVVSAAGAAERVVLGEYFSADH